MVNDATRRSLGHYLKSLAQAHDLTQQMIAADTGIERTTISKVFHGTVKKDGHYHTLAQHLGLKLDDAIKGALTMHAALTHHEHTKEGSHMTAHFIEPELQDHELQDHELQDHTAWPHPTVIAVVNKKGGVGKSTTSINLAGGLRHIYKQRILLIDLDSQGNTTKALSRETDRGESLARAFETINDDEPETLKCVHTDSNIDLVCGGPALSRAERLEALAAFRLGRILEQAQMEHDIVILDTPPNFGVLTTSALMAAQHVVIVTEPEPMSMDGITRVVASIQDARQSNRDLNLLAIVPNKVRNRVVDRENLKVLRSGRWAEFVTHAAIRQNVSLVEPYYATQTIFDYDPNSNGAHDFKAVTRELWERIHA